MQIAEFEYHPALVRQFIDGIGQLPPEFGILYPFHHIIAVRLIDLQNLDGGVERDSLIATHNVPMLQNVQGTGIHRPIQKSLNM